MKQSYIKECKNMYIEKNDTFVPDCEGYTKRMFNTMRKFNSKSEKMLTKKIRRKITKRVMTTCKKMYPAF